MFDRLATDGDRTSTGGEVIGRSGMYDERGKMYARGENNATCGICEGTWPIAGSARDWTDDGYPMVKDGDRVLCPCGKNFVFAWGGSNALFTESAGEPQTTTLAPARTVATYDQRFHVTNPRTGQPLRDMPYRIVTDDGDELEGRTDAQGYTQRITSDQAVSATLHVYDETPPLNPYWDRA